MCNSPSVTVSQWSSLPEERLALRHSMEDPKGDNTEHNALTDNTWPNAELN